MSQSDLSPSVLQQLQEIAFCGEYHKAFDADCGYCADHLKVVDRAYRLALASLSGYDKAGIQFLQDQIAEWEQRALSAEGALASLSGKQGPQPCLFIQHADGTYHPFTEPSRAWAEPHGNLTRYNCDCLNAGPKGEPSDADDGIYCQRWVYLAEDVELALASSQERWRAIESAPKDGTPILAFERGLEMRVIAWNVEDGIWLSYDGHDFGPTHWMPLPAPPSPEGETT